MDKAGEAGEGFSMTRAAISTSITYFPPSTPWLHFSLSLPRLGSVTKRKIEALGRRSGR